MILKRGQYNFVDVWDETKEGWKDNHTRVKLVKTPAGKRAFYVSGVPLPKIKYVEIAKNASI